MLLHRRSWLHAPRLQETSLGACTGMMMTTATPWVATEPQSDRVWSYQYLPHCYCTYHKYGQP